LRLPAAEAVSAYGELEQGDVDQRLWATWGEAIDLATIEPAPPRKRQETPHHSVSGDTDMERGPAAVHPRDGAEAFRRGRSHFGS